MLIDSFFTYSIKEKTEAGFVAEIKLKTDSPVYDGHFPEMPVTPGVCQVQMLKEVLNEQLNADYQLSKARDIKFLNLINPNDNNLFLLEVSIKTMDDNSINVNALMHNGDTKCMKVRAVYSQAKT
ncbi:hypothetical protein J1N10_00125 [Carboxylicivirga sp. A043]|uniref:hypothetical protein n=1 Tax=Carboxylicivirga litoralis TaxID=2816963 RepID=UPI0021CB5A6D|nr:hypothetical protein [Carboxylicivirga sp. A043]MCU4154365.1 hypothetical protein [Carboxylicivirga sp. A043]